MQGRLHGERHFFDKAGNLDKIEYYEAGHLTRTRDKYDFQEEEIVALFDKLDAYKENDENNQFDAAAEIEEIRQKLAEADRILAEVAIEDAKEMNGKPDDIAVANELFAEGETAMQQGGSAICDVALGKFEEAWEKAVKSWCELE